MQLPRSRRQFAQDDDIINRSEARLKVDNPYGSSRKAAQELR